MLLIYPPCTKAGEPPAGVARLAGALADAGKDVRVIDANYEAQVFMVKSSPVLGDTWTMRAFKRREKDLTALRSLRTYASIDRYKQSVANVNRLLETGGRGKADVSLTDYRDPGLSPLSSDDLRTSFACFDQNVFFDYFSARLDEVVGDYAEVGISLCFLNQALCAFAMAGYIRSRWPGKKIILGGSLVTTWVRKAMAFPRELFDQVIDGAGEAVLLPDGAAFGAPDYTDLYANDYLSPGRVLPYSASSGCYWNRCSFCPERTEKNPYCQQNPAAAAAQIRDLCDSYSPSLIHLLDNALSPALLDALIENPPGAPWYGFVRIAEKLKDPEYCLRLKASGCVMLKLGIESGDQGVLDAMHKGIRLEDVVRVLENLKTAGIGTYAYLLFGTPAEDEAAALRTLDFAAAHADCIDFLNLSIFNLPQGSSLADQLETRDFYAADLSLYTDFRHPRGWGRREVRNFLDRRFKRHGRLAPIVRTDPPFFSSNHAPFFLLARDGKGL